MFQQIRQKLITGLFLAGLLITPFLAHADDPPPGGSCNPIEDPGCPAPVPEPSILALFGLGFAGLVAIRRFNRKK